MDWVLPDLFLVNAGHRLVLGNRHFCKFETPHDKPGPSVGGAGQKWPKAFTILHVHPVLSHPVRARVASQCCD